MITYMFQKYSEYFALQLFIILQSLTHEIPVLFSLKVAYFLIVSIVFSLYKQNFTIQ